MVYYINILHRVSVITKKRQRTGGPRDVALSPTAQPLVPARGSRVYEAPALFTGLHITVSTLETPATRLSVGQIEGEGEAEEQEQGLGAERHLAAA